MLDIFYASLAAFEKDCALCGYDAQALLASGEYVRVRGAVKSRVYLSLLDKQFILLERGFVQHNGDFWKPIKQADFTGWYWKMRVNGREEWGVSVDDMGREQDERFPIEWGKFKG